ncbi:Aldo/keto reductase [Schizopora paradoxa]|uniref:Aldo/keto reductase n=1 Tax=Schizopora paradoxa TaxID=27342 RepID=A0A0H2RWE5_9AGAM|nr:Aldo/keto reductase [Schizopora paradoxa]
MVMPLDAPQPSFPLLSPEIFETFNDVPDAGEPLEAVGEMQLPPIVFGAGTFSNQYNEDGHLEGVTPLRTIRLALQSGINAFDTSAYYGPSEIIIGNALKTLKDEFPRSTYRLMTKCGRYGVYRENFDYSPSTIRKSVERSLARLHTTYLDVVYLHDVEFVVEAVLARSNGDHTTALTTEEKEYGLAEEQMGKVWGDGDRKFLGALAELRKMQSEGLIKHVGITGYPLPTLLRLSLLALHTAPFKPLDVLLSYSQSNLQNGAFAAFAPHFRNRAKIPQLLAASPLNMGLLTNSPPSWHPAPPALRDAVARSVKAVGEWPGGLPNVAIGFSIREKWDKKVVGNNTSEIPVVIGLSSPEEVKEAVRVWREVRSISVDEERLSMEQKVTFEMKESGYFGWAWESPAPPSE